MSHNPQKTPLYDEHVKLGARMVDFAGWLMPVQYQGLKEEHAYTRNHVLLLKRPNRRNHLRGSLSILASDRIDKLELPNHPIRFHA